jgi:hypothetical protein
MPHPQGSTPGAGTPAEDYRAHAELHAREGTSGIGAAVVRSAYKAAEHIWDCIVSDRHEWHYIRVLGPDLGPYPNISTEDIEQGIDAFAATLPAEHRIRHLLEANPLHVDRTGVVSD